VSESLQSEPTVADPDLSDAEVLDALPVLAHEPTVLRASPSGGVARPSGVMMPAVQAAAVAAGGFVAGAAVVGLVQRRQRRAAALAKGRRTRGLGRGGRAAQVGGELVQIVSSRSLLVDVHLLGPADGDR
jgi:hypothetical protein